MRKACILIFCLLSVTYVYGQVVTFQSKPGSASGLDAYLSSFGTSINYGNHPEFGGTAWTCQGNSCVGRGLIKFDLSAIPQGSTLVSAELNLYANNSPVNGNGQAMLGSNSAYLYKVTTPWAENNVTYNNQPGYSTINSVYLPQSTSSFQNYLSINVIGIVADMVSNPASNHGFLLKLVNEQPYSCMIFASSDYSDPLLWPEIIVSYVPPINDTCVVLTSADTGYSDTYLSSVDPNGNYGNHPEIAGVSWTCAGTPCYGRCLFNFDWSLIPSNASITSAYLDLYSNLSPANGNGVAMQGVNGSVLRRVTSSWSENTVTWNSQPSVSLQNQVYLAASTSAFQDYLNVDVTGIVQDIFSSPSNRYGFSIRLVSEAGYASMIFTSSDNGNFSRSPSLEVCYTLTTFIENLNVVGRKLIISPNPVTHGTLKIALETSVYGWVYIKIRSLQGQIVGSYQINCSYDTREVNLDVSEQLSDLSNGVYLLELSSRNYYSAGKIVVVK